MQYVVFSIQGWTDMWVSKHWISAKLAEDSDVYFIEPFRAWLLPGRGGRFSSFFTGPEIRREGNVNVVSFTSLPGYYQLPGVLRALARFVMRPQFARFSKLLQNGDFDIISFDYRFQPLLKMLPPPRKYLYYAIDLIPRDQQDPWWTEDQLINSADVVVAVSNRHRDRIEASSGRGGIPVIPHGIDFAGAESVTGNTAIEDLKSNGRHRVIGYTGSIHDTYVDFDCVIAVAKRHPEWIFVFIGPTGRSELGAGASNKISMLKKLPNVIFTGPKPYSEIASYIKSFDVCFMPYHPSVDNEPFKTLQYLAQGKPVVAADVPGISSYRHLLHVYQGSNPDSMEESLLIATEEPVAAEIRSRRVDFARDHDFSLVKSRLLVALEQ